MTTKLKQNVQIDGQLSATTLVGDGSNLTGIPAGYSNTDVDTHLNQNNPTQDFVLSWNGSDYAWVSNLGGGGITHIIEDTTPQLGGNLDAQAFDIMITVHKKGLAVVGVFSYEVAETKVAQVMDCARQHQHPLQCTMEKE